MANFEIHGLRKLSADSLMAETRGLAQKEREVTLQILYHLQEIERRRLHFDRGFASLHEFCVQFLGYSDGSASRRIQAARLLKDIPELEQKIEDGRLSLSVAAQAQSFFYSEQKNQKVYTIDQKQEILLNLENKSSRDATKEFLKLSPDFLPKEKVRQVTEECQELRVILDQELIRDFQELKTWLSHKLPNASYQDLIRAAVKHTNQELNKKKLGAPKKAPTSELKENIKGSSQREQGARAGRKNIGEKKEVNPPAPTPEQNRSRYALLKVRKAVWTRDDGCCAYVHLESQKKCGSKVRLEYDHVIPFSKGGPNTIQNLRIVCRQHNTQAAIREFGREKMREWVN